MFNVSYSHNKYHQREVFIDGDREKLKNEINFLQNKISNQEKQNEKAKKKDIEKDGIIDDLQNKINKLEKELDNTTEKLQEVDEIKRENAILNSAKKADDEKMEWLTSERDNDKENFDNFSKKVRRCFTTSLASHSNNQSFL